MANLNEAYDGLGIGFDNRSRCCGSQFYNKDLIITVGRKKVNIANVKAILERNKAMTEMGGRPHVSIWTELGLTHEEYLFLLKKYRKMTRMA